MSSWPPRAGKGVGAGQRPPRAEWREVTMCGCDTGQSGEVGCWLDAGWALAVHQLPPTQA